MHRLVVAGLGYVGVQLIRRAAETGMSVVGYDVDQSKINLLTKGSSYVDDVSDHEIRRALEQGFTATTDPGCLAMADTILICVPTPLRADLVPDLTAVENAVAATAEHLRPGTLVVLESTVAPGTTEGVVRSALEKSGLVAGVDFALAFSPERIDPGNAVYAFQNTPKVVSGLTPQCRARAAEFYGLLVDQVVLASGTREAEMAKLLENTYRYVNIALVNEIAAYCGEIGADVWDVIELAASKPFGFQSFRPGPGIGGHCIPVDPYYLSHRARSLGLSLRLVESAHDVNASMPRYVAQRVQAMFNSHGLALKDQTVMLLGVTYKADVADDRESPATPLTRALRTLGADVCFHDPYISDWVVDGVPVARRNLPEDLPEVGAVVLLQPHAEYDLAQIGDAARLVFDTRGLMPSSQAIRL